MKKDKVPLTEIECRERGCESMVPLVICPTVVMIPTSFANMTPSYACPMCGRLHWVEGDAVLSRQHEKAFLSEGTIVHHPLDSGEKMALIREITTSVEVANESDEAIRCIEISRLINMGHAPDCSARFSSPCNCGKDDAVNWLIDREATDNAVLVIEQPATEAVISNKR